MTDCDHKNRNIKWDKDHLIHTCRLCHHTWTEPRRKDNPDEETE